jgi:hypothetical protein
VRGWPEEGLQHSYKSGWMTLRMIKPPLHARTYRTAGIIARDWPGLVAKIGFYRGSSSYTELTASNKLRELTVGKQGKKEAKF